MSKLKASIAFACDRKNILERIFLNDVTMSSRRCHYSTRSTNTTGKIITLFSVRMKCTIFHQLTHNKYLSHFKIIQKGV